MSWLFYVSVINIIRNRTHFLCIVTFQLELVSRQSEYKPLGFVKYLSESQNSSISEKCTTVEIEVWSSVQSNMKRCRSPGSVAGDGRFSRFKCINGASSHVSYSWAPYEIFPTVSRSTRFQELPLDVLKRIMWQVMGSRTPDLLGYYSRHRMKDAYSLCVAYPPLQSFFLGVCKFFRLDHSWAGVNTWFLAQMFANSIRHLVLTSHCKLEAFLYQLALHNPTLVSLQLDLDIQRLLGTSRKIGYLLATIADSSKATLRSLDLRISSSTVCKWTVGELIRPVLPHLTNISSLSTSGRFELELEDLLALVVAAGSNLRELTLGHTDTFNEEFTYETFLKPIREACPGITNLALSDFWCEHFGSGVDTFFASFGEGLRDVNLVTYDPFSEFEYGFVNKDDFDGYESEHEPLSADVGAVLAYCTKLTHVKIAFRGEEFDTTIGPLEKVSGTLQSLRLLTFDYLEVGDFCRLEGLLPQLREFRMETYHDNSDALYEICRRIGAQLHVLHYTGTACSSVLCAVAMYCTQLKSLSIGTVSESAPDFLDSLSDSEYPERFGEFDYMDFMLSRIGQGLNLFSLRGGDHGCSEIVTIDGLEFAESICKYCTQLKVLQIVEMEYCFYKKEDYRKACRMIQRKMPGILLYLKCTLPESIKKDWTCSSISTEPYR